MNNHRRYDQLRELSWRRSLTTDEEAELRSMLALRPEMQVDWEAECSLTEALRHLPDAPLSSNFTARVLQTVNQESTAPMRHKEFTWLPWHWGLRMLPRFALGAVVLAAGVFSYHHVQDVRQSHEWVRPLEVVSGVASLPNAEILRDFDAIRALDRNPAPDAGADEELLRALQ